jgi:hypothetical protein
MLRKVTVKGKAGWQRRNSPAAHPKVGLRACRRRRRAYVPKERSTCGHAAACSPSSRQHYPGRCCSLLAAPAAHALNVKPLTKDLLTTKLSTDRLLTSAEGALEETTDLVDQLGSNLDTALEGSTSLSGGLSRAAKDPLTHDNNLGTACRAR